MVVSFVAGLHVLVNQWSLMLFEYQERMICTKVGYIGCCNLDDYIRTVVCLDQFCSLVEPAQENRYMHQCVILVQYIETGLPTGSGAIGVGNNSAS
jgi:hypothetical protein